MVKRLFVLLLAVPAFLAVTPVTPASADLRDYIHGNGCTDPADCPMCPGIWVNGQWTSLCL